MWAATYGHLEIAEILLQAGASTDHQSAVSKIIGPP